MGLNSFNLFHFLKSRTFCPLASHILCSQLNHQGGFSGGSVGKESACSAGDLVQSLGWEDPLKPGITTHSSILAWRLPLDRGAWQATVHGGHKELDTTEWLMHAHPLTCPHIFPPASSPVSCQLLHLWWKMPEGMLELEWIWTHVLLKLPSA